MGYPLYRAEVTHEKSGLDREGMILVATMSGDDTVIESETSTIFS